MRHTPYIRPRGGRGKIIVVLLVLGILVLLGTLAAAFFLTPGYAPPQLGEGDLILTVEEEQAVLVWPQGVGADGHTLSLRREGEEEFAAVGQYTGCRTQLKKADLLDTVTLRLEAYVAAKNLLGMERVLRSEPREVTIAPRQMARPAASGVPSEEDKTLSLSWQAQDGDSYEVCLVEEDGTYAPIAAAQGGRVVLRFGENADLDMPGYDRPTRIVLRAVYQGEGYVLQSLYSEAVSVEKESLLGDDLHLEYQETGERMYTLRWNETKGGYYEIQEWVSAQRSAGASPVEGGEALDGGGTDGEAAGQEAGHWETLARFDRDAELCYETGRLASGSSHRYRVAAFDTEAAEHFGAQEENVFSADPSEVSFRAAVTPLYCTVWPVVDLTLYSEARDSSSALEQVEAGTALCVLEESGDWFYVRHGEAFGYVDSRFCMIDLTEYLGDLCAYEIANSYRSVFKVNIYPIEGVTYQTVQGFEHVKVGEGTYLTPFLYPCAQKLQQAAQAAQADGFRLKIYDAYRPNEATRYLFDTTSLLLETAVPPLDEEGRVIDLRTGMSIDSETGFLIDPETGELIDPATLPEPEEEEEPTLPEEGIPTLPGEGETPTEGEEPQEGETSGEGEDSTQEPVLPGVLPEDTDGLDEAGLTTGAEEELLDKEVLTYGMVMTDGRFRIGSFLAASVSAHNRGIALDLTLESLETGEELPMQSAIHDLSWYSATYLNNDNAKLLASYMTGVGMRGLTSEWWHFQDDETREAIGLTSHLFAGVSPEGWKKDDHGWRYREADGSYRRGGTITVDGKQYALDGNGYVIP